MALQKRGQITIFIILGIMLLISVAFFLLIRQEASIIPAISVPKAAAPVYNFVIGCVDSITEEAIKLQGLQGGYIRIPEDISRTPSAYLQVDPSGVLKIPYWFFEGQDRVVPLSIMEQEIARYVVENLPSCLDGFSVFNDQFVITVKSPVIASATSTQKEVIVKLDWIIDVQSPEGTNTLTQFASFVPVRLREIWDLANRTMMQENKQTFFENLTIDLMSANPAIPMDGMFVDCSHKTWQLSDIKKIVKGTMYYNVPAIRVKNTVQLPFDDLKKAYDDVSKFTFADIQEGRFPKSTPADSYEYFRMQFDPGMYDTPLHAGFVYLPDWGMDFTAHPNDGGVLKSKVAQGPGYLRILCMNIYHFAYDVIYPVKMVISDPEAFNHRGYKFQFAFPVVINSNAPSRTTFSTRLFTGYTQSTGFCQDLGSSLVDIRALSTDVDVGELNNVNISLRCFSQTCELGRTKVDKGYYRLRTPLPRGCTNPFIIAEKEGYLKTEAQLTGDLLELELPKLRKMKVEVVRHPYGSIEKIWLPGEPLAEANNVTIKLSLSDGSYDQFLQLPAPVQELNLIDDDATYDIDVLLTLFDDLVGGYHAEGQKVKYADLEGRDTVVFHVFEYRPITRNQQYSADVAAFLATGDYAKELKVEFK